MNLSKHDRAYLAEEIGILLTETYWIGFGFPTTGEPTSAATEAQVKATVLEAISRTLDSRIALPGEMPK